MIVLDASVALSWVLADEGVPEAEEAMRQVMRNGAVVPRIWRYEMLNALLVAERRGRMNSREVADTLADLAQLPITVDEGDEDADILGAARRRKLSAYDAAYLALAGRRRLPLATLDNRLRSAASAEGVPLVTN